MLATAAAGLGVAHSPTLTAGAMLLVGGGIGLVAAPGAALPALAVAATAAGAPFLLLAQTGAVPSIGKALAGEGKIVVLLAGLVLGRAVIGRAALVFPRPLAVVLFAYFTFQLVSIWVGTRLGHPASPAIHALVQQISYVSAFVVGASGGVTGGDRRTAEGLRTGLAYVAICINVSVCWYWAWAAHLAPAMPLMSRVFGAAATAGSRYGDRSVFPFVNDSPNLGAVAVALLAVFLFPQLVHSVHHRRGRLLAVVVAVTATAAVLATQSRSGLISLAAGAAIYVLLSQRGQQRKRAWIVLSLAVLVGLQGYRLLPKERRISLNAPTLVTRQDIWRQGERSVEDHPFLGQGFHFSASNPFVQPIIDPGPESPATQMQSVHNQYLEAAVDGGLPGEAVLIALLVTLGLIARRALCDPTTRHAGVGFAAALGTLLVSMTVGSSLDSAVVAIFLWLIAGITAGMQAGSVGGGGGARATELD